MARIMQVRQRFSSRLTIITVLLVLLVGTLVVTPTTRVQAVNDQWNIVCSNSPSTVANYLFGVAAQANDAVVAVGSKSISAQYKPLVELWEPTSPGGEPCFQEITTPNPPLSGHSELEGIARVPSGSATLRPFWAVGYQGASTRTWNSDAGDWIIAGGAQTLIEYSSDGGQTWSIVSSPNRPNASNVLKGVTVRSDDDAWAVGYSDDGSGPVTLIEHWNGLTWSIVSSPNQSGAYANYLNGVSIVDKYHAWAVGYANHSTQPVHQNLILHWDGTSWSEDSEPQPSPYWNYLFSVTGISTSLAHALGTYLPYPYIAKDTEALKWDGSNWYQIGSPSPGTGANVFFGSAAVTSEYAWAVGSAENPHLTTLTARWTGGDWTQVPSPNANTNNNELRGVGVVPGTSPCAGGNNFAVGWYADDSGIAHTLAMLYYVTPTCDLTP